MTELLKLKYFYIIVLSFATLTIVTSNKISADQQIKIIADEIRVNKIDSTVEASGNAQAVEEKGSKLKSEFILYDEEKALISAEGNVVFNDVEGNRYYIHKI